MSIITTITRGNHFQLIEFYDFDCRILKYFFFHKSNFLIIVITVRKSLLSNEPDYILIGN